MAVVGNPDRSGTMSEPLIASVVVALLLAALPSFVAPVVPFRVEEPVAVGVPDTVQVIVAPGATVAGGVGEQSEVSPAGNPAIAQLALEAATAGALAFVQV